MTRWSPAVDRPVLVSNLVSGAGWLLVPVAVGQWPLSAIGMVYVIPASLVMAVLLARPSLSRRRRALAWGVPWLGAAAVWVWMIGGIEAQTTNPFDPFVLVVGLGIGTTLFVAWQIVASAIRAQYLGWPKDEAARTAASSD